MKFLVHASSGVVERTPGQPARYRTVNAGYCTDQGGGTPPHQKRHLSFRSRCCILHSSIATMNLTDPYVFQKPLMIIVMVSPRTYSQM